MLNQLWSGLILIAMAMGAVQGAFSEVNVINGMVASVFDSAKLAIEIAIGLMGVLILWLGLFAIAEAAGVITIVAKLTMPVLRRFMPDVPKDHPAFGSVSINIAMGMLGMDNGALPSALKAMQQLETLNTQPGKATKAQQVFLVYMTTSVTLFPLSIINYRMQAGAINPADVLLPLILTGYAGLMAGLLYIATALKISLLDRQIAGWILVLVSVLSGFTWLAATLPAQKFSGHATWVGNLALLAAMAWFIVAGLKKNIPVFETFIRGAAEGFALAVALMPYLVGMLVAIGLLKSSGTFALLQSALVWLFQHLGIDTLWAQVVPHGMMKLFSGGGARSMMIESFKTNGVDSLAGHLSAIVQGAFDTTFYVLAVCAAAAKLNQLGHAIAAALVANVTSFMVAVLFTKLFFQ